MQREIKKYLFDIKISIDSVFEFLGDLRDFNVYLSNKLLRSGVERHLGIIGEAVNKILKLDATIDLEDARKIVNLRNWVIHNYDKIDDAIVWGIINKQLPVLKKQVDELLKKLNDNIGV